MKIERMVRNFIGREELCVIEIPLQFVFFQNRNLVVCVDCPHLPLCPRFIFVVRIILVDVVVFTLRGRLKYVSGRPLIF